MQQSSEIYIFRVDFVIILYLQIKLSAGRGRKGFFGNKIKTAGLEPGRMRRACTIGLPILLRAVSFPEIFVSNFRSSVFAYMFTFLFQVRHLRLVSRRAGGIPPTRWGATQSAPPADTSCRTNKKVIGWSTFLLDSLHKFVVGENEKITHNIVPQEKRKGSHTAEVLFAFLTLMRMGKARKNPRN